MAHSDKNVIITPNVGSSTDDPKIIFSGADASASAQNITIKAYPTSNGTLSIEGSAGQLFSVTNSMSGSIFSVNDVSGIPSIEVLDSGLIKFGQYSGNVLLGTGTDSGFKLDVNGTGRFVGAVTASSFSGAGTGLTGTASSLSIGGSSGSVTNAVTFNNGGSGAASGTTFNGSSAVTISYNTVGAAASSHTHNYAGSASAGGAASSLSNFTVTTTTSVGAENTTSAIGYIAGISLLGQSDGALYSHLYSADWKHQIYGDYRTGQIAIRGKNNGTWQTWRTVLDSSNYNSYSPTLTGGGASGSWGISVTGSAGSVAWSGITSKPTTVSGYGITNALVRGGAIGSIDFNAQRTLASGIYSVDAAPTNGPPASAYSNFIQMYERGDTAAQLVIEYSSGRMYSRGIQTAVPIYSPWRTQIDDGNYTSYAMPAGSSATNSVDVRAPIFYDSNDTGFYVDPASTSSHNYIRANRIILDRNYGHSIFGLYESTRYQGVWSMGESWLLPADGTTTGNLYGLAWSHPNAGGAAGNLNDHGLLVLVNGGFRASITGSIRCVTDMRSPVFYDYNNTGYYVDPNGTSQCSRINCDNMFYGNGNWSYFTGIYDTNDTAYYVDPNSVSSLNDCRANVFYLRGDTNNYFTPNALFIRGASPTIYFRDTDANCAMLHNNSNLLYILRGGNDTTTWTTVGSGSWPMTLNLTNNDVTWGGNISAIYNVTAYASDKRLKENIKEIPNAIEKIKKIRGVTFDWNDLAEEVGFTPENKYNDIGVIAQEIEEVLPQVITLAPFDRWTPEPEKEYSEEELSRLGKSKSGEDYKTVQYDRIVPLLIQGIKEQQNQIDKQQETINKLKLLLNLE